MELTQAQLGALVAVTAVLALLVVVGVGVAVSVWTWARSHKRGEMRWTETSATLHVDSLQLPPLPSEEKR